MMNPLAALLVFFAVCQRDDTCRSHRTDAILSHVAQDHSLKPEDPGSDVHPRKFGLPGGLGKTRGWYVWHKFDANTWQAEVSHEHTGTKYTVRVLPWLTTYRHLAYGAH